MASLNSQENDEGPNSPFLKKPSSKKSPLKAKSINNGSNKIPSSSANTAPQSKKVGPNAPTSNSKQQVLGKRKLDDSIDDETIDETSDEVDDLFDDVMEMVNFTQDEVENIKAQDFKDFSNDKLKFLGDRITDHLNIVKISEAKKKGVVVKHRPIPKSIKGTSKKSMRTYLENNIQVLHDIVVPALVLEKETPTSTSRPKKVQKKCDTIQDKHKKVLKSKYLQPEDVELNAPVGIFSKDGSLSAYGSIVIDEDNNVENCVNVEASSILGIYELKSTYQIEKKQLVRKYYIEEERFDSAEAFLHSLAKTTTNKDSTTPTAISVKSNSPTAKPIGGQVSKSKSPTAVSTKAQEKQLGSASNTMNTKELILQLKQRVKALENDKQAWESDKKALENDKKVLESDKKALENDKKNLISNLKIAKKLQHFDEEFLKGVMEYSKKVQALKKRLPTQSVEPFLISWGEKEKKITKSVKLQADEIEILKSEKKAAIIPFLNLLDKHFKIIPTSDKFKLPQDRTRQHRKPLEQSLYTSIQRAIKSQLHLQHIDTNCITKFLDIKYGEEVDNPKKKSSVEFGNQVISVSDNDETETETTKTTVITVEQANSDDESNNCEMTDDGFDDDPQLMDDEPESQGVQSHD